MRPQNARKNDTVTSPTGCGCPIRSLRELELSLIRIGPCGHIIVAESSTSAASTTSVFPWCARPTIIYSMITLCLVQPPCRRVREI